jgi:hypothetical protein
MHVEGAAEALALDPSTSSREFAEPEVLRYYHAGGFLVVYSLRPNLLPDGSQPVAGAGDLGADLGGGPLIVAGEIDRLRARVGIQVLEVT